MNEEIKALIDREAEERFSLDIFKAFSDFELSAAKFEFKNGALFALSLFRWRKVSEGLPEIGKKILIRNSKRVTTRRFYSISEIELCIKAELITHWMPIPEGGKDE
uniref:hypothetical protein n=1 Tax=uncultured Dysgonomonas sp. TaxID=206096 RepID=UPI002631CF16|nr:hypothetical protein [uncultured Dysgonomonas sp.]